MNPATRLGAFCLFGVLALVLCPAPVAGQEADPRPDLAPGMFDAEEAAWNLRLVANAPPPERFVGAWNSDLAFTGNYVIQGNWLGFQIWDISDPTRPELASVVHCPGAQNDVSVIGDLLFLSVEEFSARLDCGTEGVQGAVSEERMRGIRIFDISDVRNPEYVASVQTCRGSHTHTVLEDASDPDHVYVYVSGVQPVRPPQELDGCLSPGAEGERASPLAHIEVIRVPTARPELAAVVSKPRILEGLLTPPTHGPSAADVAAAEEARARGAFVATFMGEAVVLPPQMIDPMLESSVEARGGEGPPTAADSAKLREELPGIIAQMAGDLGGDGPITICHDVTVYPAAGLAGGACIGYGVLLDIDDPAGPKRLDAVADSNFAAWHSATFNNDGTTVLFTDEWGGGTQPKCRPGDPPEWGANAIFAIEDGELAFRSYFKLPAPQSELENCVAHNGSLIPIPGRDVMVQGWYQGGISVIDFTDPANPVEIAYFDRGPWNGEEMEVAGSFSAYWYNGLIVSSEMLRGLDVLELVPSEHLSGNEIEAAKTVRLEQLNVQQQPKFEWPVSVALARAYLDQLERSEGLPPDRIAAIRSRLNEAENALSDATGLTELVRELEAARSRDRDQVGLLAGTVKELAAPR